MTAPRAREQADPPSPPDRRPPRRGGGSCRSSYAAFARAAVLLALTAAALLGGVEARAQTSEVDHWSATLTREGGVNEGGTLLTDSAYGYSAANPSAMGGAIEAVGTLVPSTFTYGSVSYTVQRLFVTTADDNAVFQTSPALPTGAGLRLSLPTFRTSPFGACTAGGTSDFDLNASSADASVTGRYEWDVSSGTICLNSAFWGGNLSTTGTVKLVGPPAGGTPTNNPPVFTSSANLSVEENTTNATVVAVDNDTDDGITGYAITGGTDQNFFSDVTSAGVLTFDEAPNFEDPKDSGTDNTYVVTVQATSGTGTREMTATQTITVTVTDADEQSAKPDKPTLAAVAGSSTSLTATWTKPDLNGGPDIATYDVAYRERPSGGWEDFGTFGVGLTTTITGLTADTSYQARVRTSNDEALSDWSDASDAVKTNAAMPPATCTLNTGDVWCGVVTVGTFMVSGTSHLGYLPGTGGGGMLSDDDFDFTDTDLDSASHTITSVLLASGTLSLVFEIAPDEDEKPVLNTWELQVGTDTFALDDDDVTELPTGGYQWPGTGLSWSVGDTVTLRLRGESAPPSVASVAVTSMPLLTSSGGSEEDTYGAGDEIEFTVTFSRAVTVTGDPQFGFSLSGARQADHDPSRSSGTALKFVYTVQSSDSDDDGIWIGNHASGNKSLQLDANDGITSPGGIDANLEHDQLQVQAGHKVDGSRSSKPTLNVFDVTTTEGGGVATIVLTLSAAAAEDVTVTCTASLSTFNAAEADDFVLGTTTGTVSAGQTTGSCTVALVDDTTDEPDETFTVTLSDVSSNAQLEATSASVTIQDNDDPPMLSVNDVSGTEGTSLTFTVTLSAESEKTVTVDYATSEADPQSAVSGTDFTAASGTLTFSPGDPGDTTKTITVATTGDTTVETNETFTVTLSNPGNATLGTKVAATGTINDDDATVPTLSVADAAATEGDDVIFTVTLSEAAAATVTATWTSSTAADQTATAGMDYLASTGTVTITAPNQSTTFEVQTTADTTVEVNETFTVTLSGVSSNAALADATAVGTINNDDLVTVSIADDAEGDEDEGVEFTLTLSAAAPEDVSVHWTASVESGDSASAEDLATTKTGTVTITKGATTKMFTVPVNDDSTDEPDQTFTVTLSNPAPASLAQLAADPTATGTIDDDDDPPTISVMDMTVNEGDLNPDDIPTQGDNPGYPFRIELSEASEKRVRYRLRQVVDGTATDADLRVAVAFQGYPSVAVGTTSVVRGVNNIVNDSLDEDDETFTVEVYDLENATAGAKTSSTITIEDDDPTPTVTVADAAATEGDKVEFVVTLSAVSGRDVEVGYATSVATGDTAVSGTDFTAATGTLTIAAADSTATGTVEVQTTEDDANESAETFTLTLSATKNVELTTDTTATGTINNRATTAAKPTGFEAAVGDAQVTLTWDTPPTGVTRHEYQYKAGTGAYQGWVRIENSGVGGANEDGFTVTGLTNETEYTFQLRAVNAQGESTAAEADPVTPTPGICGRTQKVHEAIVYYLEDRHGVERTCTEVNVADLALLTYLEASNQGIASLKSGDFAGLTGLATLELTGNTFTTLPADVFSGLTSLETLVLSRGALSSIPDGLFSGLSALKTLQLNHNDLTALDAGVFSGLSALQKIDLQQNDLTMLPANVFSGLSALTSLPLHNNDLTALPDGLFSGLSALTTLQLHNNDLTALDAGVFSGLSNLLSLTLQNNDLSSLPDGLFSGLTAVTALKLDGNTVDPLPLTVTVEKFGTDQARAKVLAGAPAAVSFNVTVANGSLASGVPLLTVAAGSVDGTAVTVTRTTGTMAAVTVDIDLSTQPTLPTNHAGYAFAKAASGLPAEILPDTRGPQNFIAKPGDGQAVLSWTAPASGSGVTKHQYRQKEGTGSYGNWTDIPNSAEGEANEDGFTVTGLTNETVYTFELRSAVGTTNSATAESNAVTPTPGICGRTQQVREVIVATVSGADACNEVTVANLAGVTHLGIGAKGITTLRAGDFAGLTGLTNLSLAGNRIASFPRDVFSDLEKLEVLEIQQNEIASLRADAFSGLSTLTTLSLLSNNLSSLPEEVFSGLTSLEQLYLDGNDLTSLPAGLFSGLTALTGLNLSDNPNTGDTLPLTVTVEKVGTDRVQAKVLAGAPFAVAIPVTVENGTLAGGVAALTVAKGSVESPAETVTRTEGTTDAVTVDVDLSTQPILPSDHEGYFFARAASGLPAEILPEEASLEPPTGLSATPGDRQAVLAWTPPAADSGFTRHQYRYRTDGSWQPWTDIPDSGPNETNGRGYTVTGLANAVAHRFELRARDAGAGKSDPATATVTPAGPPRIVTVEVTSGPGLDHGTTYGVGEEIRISVTFDQRVAVEGDPELALEVGGESRLAQYDSGSDTDTLVFVYVVQASDDDGDGIEVGDDALRLDSGDEIDNGEGDQAELAHDGTGAQPGHKVDGGRQAGVHTHQAFTHSHARSGELYPEHAHEGHEHPDKANGHPAGLRPGQHVHHEQEQPHPSVNSGPDLRTHGGVVHTHLCYDLEPSCDQGDDFKYRGGELGLPIEVTHSHENSEPGHGFEWRAWFEEGGSGATVSVADAAAVGGEDAHLRFEVTLEPAQAFAVRVDYATADGTAAAGEDYTETSGVLEIAPGETRATVRVPLRDRAPGDGDETLTLTLNWATAAMVPLDETTGTILAPEATTAPAIERIEVVSTPRLWSPRDGKRNTYGEGENIRIAVRFDQRVLVEGDPKFALEVGDPCRAVCAAGYESGSGTDTLVFAYLVLEVDVDRNGIAIRGNPVEVSGDRIRNAAGQDADLTFKGKGTQSGHKVDGSRQAPSHFSVEDAEAHEADGEMAFTVRLEPHGLGIVRVDYATADGTATAGEDYTETSGTLTFNSLETERTVTVPVVDDAVLDDGETFTLTLSNADGAKLRSGDDEATGTIHNSEPRALTVALVEGMPARHDGSERFGVRVRFNAPVDASEEEMAGHGVQVQGGRVHSAGRVPAEGDGEGPGTRGAKSTSPGSGESEASGEVWQIEIEPDGDGDVTVSIEAGRPCDEEGAICTADGRALSEGISTTVEGPATGPALTASFEGMPEAHDGESAFTFQVAFSEDIGISYRSLREDAFEVAGGRVTRGTRVDDRRDLFEMTVEPDGGGEVTVTLPAGRECSVSGAICTKGENRRQLTNAPAATVAGAEVETAGPALTAAFEGMPAAHDGAGAFRFRVAFSADIGISYRSLREDAFEVAGGRVTRGARVDDRRDLFEMTVEPDGEGAVTVTLPAGRECSVSGAICTKGENRRQLTNAPAATVAGPAVETAGPALTASFVDMPSEHDGETAFKFRIAFSEEIRMSGRRLRSDVVAVSGGQATKAGRVKGRKDLWKLTVRPDSLADVTVTLSSGAACDAPGAVCTADGRALSNTVSATVKGPVAVSVADARAREGEDETIDFAVSLSRAAPGPVSVSYATADGTATAGSDYRARQGKLKFAAGETEKTISVPVLDDVVDEGEETFTLRLLNASGAVVADGEATGTIVNSDPLQKMWLSRFGRTVAGQVVDAVTGRLSGPSGGSQVTLGGQGIDLSAPSADTVDARRTLAGALGAERGADDDDPLAGPGSWEAARAGSWEDPEAGATVRSMTGRELLLGSSFHLAAGAGEAGGPGYAAWGRVAVGGFDAEAPADNGTLRLDGEVTTGILGADAEWERWLAGVALSVSSAEGTFDQPGVDSGTVESTLTSVNPYVRYEASDRLSVWGLVGYGTGDMTIRGKSPVRTDLMLRLGAAGARGVLLEADEDGGIDLALRGDAFLVQMESEAAENSVETKADASRLRLVLETGRSFALGEGAVLTPMLELGLRHDGGDAETGTGVEVGGRIRYTDAGSGLTVEANARKLIAHEDSGYEEWGAGGAVRLDPGASGRGLSLSLAPVWGTPSSGVDRLWSARDAAGLVRDDDFEAESRLEGEVGYGFGAFGQRGVVTPYAGFGLAEAGDRTWRAGARWSLAPHLAMSLDGARREPANDDAPEHGVRFGLTLRW